MSILRRITSLFFALWLVAQPLGATAHAQAEEGARLSILSSTADAIVIALTVNDYHVEAAEDGAPFQQIVIAGATQTLLPGASQTPTLGALLGLPTPQGVTLTVVAADWEELTGYQLGSVDIGALPKGATHFGSATHLSNASTTGEAADRFLPASPVALGDVGYVRDQAVAQVQFYPVQYNAARGLIRLYRRLVVRITWQQAATCAAPSTAGLGAKADARQCPLDLAPTATDRGASAPYEQLLRHALLNYATLPRSPAIRQSLPATATRVAATSAITPALKIGITAPGLYKLTAADLRGAGFDPTGVDPRTWQLTNRGAAIPLLVAGEEDGSFDPADYLLFYGVGLNDRYTVTNRYWLTAGGAAGVRMQQRGGEPATVAPAQHFLATQHREEDTVYWQNMPGRGEDRWFWGRRLSPNTQGLAVARPYTITLSNVTPATTATMRVRLKGYTSQGHRSQIYVNDHLVDDQSWQGQGQFTHTATLSATFLRAGANVIAVTTVDQGVIPDQILVNWIELDAPQLYEADADRLWFSSPADGTMHFAIRGFTAPDLWLFDVTAANNPLWLNPVAVTPDGAQYTLHFQAAALSTSRYLGLTAGQAATPATVELDQPSTWRSPTNGADYLVITHEDFAAAAQRLADHRRGQGLRVAVVKVGDLYDEFNAGIFSPQALHDFLAYAYTQWQAPAPTYVVLLGDANQDYKDNLHEGGQNYVPSPLIESELFGEVSSDVELAAVHGDDPLPDLLIGRLSAHTAAEASAIVDKIIAYEQNPPDATWNQHVLLVADDDEAQFRTLAEQLASRLPPYYPVQRLYAAAYPPGDLTADLISALNQGRVLVNYSGHGEYFGWGQWADESRPIFTVAEVAQLHNATRLPVITLANCLNGFFAGPQANPALAEVLQRHPTGGAVAVWAPTSLGYATGHRILLDYFYQALFVDDQRSLGTATTAAALATYEQNRFWRELIQTYVLFGDPAMAVRVPARASYSQVYLPVIAR